jgi:uroporphyrinogen-III decarboxylase
MAAMRRRSMKKIRSSPDYVKLLLNELVEFWAQVLRQHINAGAVGLSA